MDVDVARRAAPRAGHGAVRGDDVARARSGCSRSSSPRTSTRSLAICERWEVRADAWSGGSPTAAASASSTASTATVLADVPGGVAPRGRAAVRPTAATPATGATSAIRPTLDVDRRRRGADLLALLADTGVGVAPVRPPAVPQHRRRSGRRRHRAAAEAPRHRATTPAAALALTTDGNHRWCAVDPRAGTARVVAEAVLNLACVGARPLALVNCLNFGNPEHPEVMWQFSEAIDGMAEACTRLGIPVVGGNVSLYNETRGHDIDPTPVVGVLGPGRRARAPAARAAARDGRRPCWCSVRRRRQLAGSRWAWPRRRGRRAAGPRPVDASPPWPGSCGTGGRRPAARRARRGRRRPGAGAGRDGGAAGGGRRG